MKVIELVIQRTPSMQKYLAAGMRPIIPIDGLICEFQNLQKSEKLGGYGGKRIFKRHR